MATNSDHITPRYEQAYKRVRQVIWDCSSGEISFLFSIPKTGYWIGEHMYVTADIRNMSNREILYSEVAINQTITFKAGESVDFWALGGTISVREFHPLVLEKKNSLLNFTLVQFTSSSSNSD